MKNLTLENIARVCGGTYYGPADKLQEEVMSVITYCGGTCRCP